MCVHIMTFFHRCVFILLHFFHYIFHSCVFMVPHFFIECDILSYWDSHNSWASSARVIYRSARVNNCGSLSNASVYLLSSVLVYLDTYIRYWDFTLCTHTCTHVHIMPSRIANVICANISLGQNQNFPRNIHITL